MKTRYLPQRILITCPNWVGDAVMATPTLRAVRNCYPAAEIAILARPNIAELLDGLPFFDRTIRVTDRKGLRSLAKLGLSLRRDHFDLALVLTHSFRSALLARLAAIRTRIGYDLQGRGFLLTDALQPLREGLRKLPQYMGEEYLGIVRYAGCESKATRPQLAVSPQAQQQAEELLASSGAEPKRPLIGISPGAFFGPSKMWYPQRWAAVADALVERYNASIAILTAPIEHEIYQDIESRMCVRPIPLRDVPVPLDLLKAIVRELDLLLSTDCGTRQIAVAFDVPTVVVMGPTDPRYTVSDCEKGVVIRKELPCGPCHEKVCPTDHMCMKGITTENVLEAASRMLRKEDAFYH